MALPTPRRSASSRLDQYVYPYFVGGGEVFQMGGAGTSILGRPRTLPGHRSADPRYTLNCDEPHLWRRPRDATTVHAFIVTDSLVECQQIVARLDPTLKSTRREADYLRNFEINTRA